MLKQYTAGQITKALTESPNHTSVSYDTVKADMVAIRKQWAANTKDRYDEYVGAELERVGLVEKEAWVGWHSSVLEGVPDKSYLDIVLKCVNARIKVLGIDKTVTNNVNIIQNNIDARQALYSDYGKLQSLSDSELLYVLKQETEDREALAKEAGDMILDIPAGMA